MHKLAGKALQPAELQKSIGQLHDHLVSHNIEPVSEAFTKSWQCLNAFAVLSERLRC